MRRKARPRAERAELLERALGARGVSSAQRDHSAQPRGVIGVRDRSEPTEELGRVRELAAIVRAKRFAEPLHVSRSCVRRTASGFRRCARETGWGGLRDGEDGLRGGLRGGVRDGMDAGCAAVAATLAMTAARIPSARIQRV